MMIRKSLLTERVSVETYQGENAYGPVYAKAVTVRAGVEPTRRLVRGLDGEEVVSEMTLYVHPDDAAAFVPESRVTYQGRTSRMLTVSPQILRGSLSFLKVACS